MVARINFSSSLRNVLNYNETKLRQDSLLKDETGRPLNKAVFLHAAGYAKDTEKLGFTDKFKRLEKQMQLSETRKKSVVHISLNFDPSEKDKLDKETLKRIADTYMEKIGFAAQPYLVYQHNDAGHPHIHIVSTIVQNSGVPIETHNIGKNFSEPARKQIEQSFNLVRAEGRQQLEILSTKPVNVQKIQYGKGETKRAITNVLDAVLSQYKYTSLSELNAVLRQYNVMADRGAENSRVHCAKGLVYRALDEGGKPIGVPIKASKIYSNPGLPFLEQRFERNKELRSQHRQRLKSSIDFALSKPSVTSMMGFQDALLRDKIQVVLRRNDNGRTYGITFIDHGSKSVFNGSDIANGYSLSAIEQKLLKTPVQSTSEVQLRQAQTPASFESQQTSEKQGARHKQQHTATTPSQPSCDILQKGGKELLADLIKPEGTTEPVPNQLKQKRKRKRKRIHL